jgi:O-acetyl-ADP-ribose deacetylase (regulator of RNase III)
VLGRAYRSAFARARERGDIRSIAFPAISTGIYGYPKRAAAQVALGVMREEEPGFDRIVACLFDDESARLYQELLSAR